MKKPSNQICKICKHPNDGKLFLAKEMMFGIRDEFYYFQCTVCECLQIAEIPDNLDNYYPSDYYSFSIYDGKRFKGLGGRIYEARTKATLFRRSVFQQLLHLIDPVAKLTIFKDIIDINARVLDVGCGNGDMFLYPLQEAGLKNLAGCDPYIPENIQYSQNLTIYKKDIFGMDGLWDIIIFNHSFEHIPNPQETLDKVSKLLSPNGVCILRIPTVPSLAWSHFGTNWAQLDAPRHLFLHSPKSIQFLSGKSNLTLQKVIYDSTFFQFAGSEAIASGIPLLQMKEKNEDSFIKRKLKKMRYQKLARELNSKDSGDQAIFYISKSH